MNVPFQSFIFLHKLKLLNAELIQYIQPKLLILPYKVENSFGEIFNHIFWFSLLFFLEYSLLYVMNVFHTLITRITILLLAFYLRRKLFIFVVICFSLDNFDDRAFVSVLRIKMKRIESNIGWRVKLSVGRGLRLICLSVCCSWVALKGSLFLG